MKKAKIFDYVFNHGASRFQGTFAAYLNPTFFGFGAGNWEIGSLTGLIKNPILYENSIDFQNGLWGPRPTSFFAGLLNEAGLFSLLLIFILLIKNISIEKQRSQEIRIEYALPAVVSLFFLGDIGNPAPFISIAILLRSKYHLKQFF